MIFEVDVNGRVRAVSIEPLGAAGPAGGRFRVVVDGEAREVTMSPTDLGVTLAFDADRRVADVAVTERPLGEYLLQLPHVTLTATVDGRRFRRGPAGRAAGDGEQRVTAPMPGRVVRVLVRSGEDVSARQGLVVVEAMKMENELASPKAGRIKEVAVTEGQSVEAGRLLVVVE